MFHVSDNLFFGRRDNSGAVRIVKFNTSMGRSPASCWIHGPDAVTRLSNPPDWPDANGDFQSVEVVFDVTLTADSWASVVASVSQKGEGDMRFYKARDFHNEGQFDEKP